jgi:MFS transporter, ACS family, solute carrier family 17 (sodium-dependent inorganic phosphate cotransporter), other
VGIGATAVLTLVTPLAANSSFYMLLAVRIIEGIFEGVTFPWFVNRFVEN